MLKRLLALSAALIFTYSGAEAQSSRSLYQTSDGGYIKPTVNLCVPATGNVAIYCSGSPVTITDGGDIALGQTTSPSISCAQNYPVLSCLRQLNADLLAPLPAATPPYNIIGAVVPAAASAGGTFFLCSLTLKATATACGSSAAHQPYMMVLDNNANAVVVYWQFFNKAVGSVTLGTTAPDGYIPVAAGGQMTVPIPVGLMFSTAMTVACTTTPTGNTSPTNNCNVTVLGQ